MVISALIIYTLKLSSTVALYAHYSEIKQVAENDDLENEVALLESELQLTNRLMGRDRKNLDEINKELLSVFSNYTDTTQTDIVRLFPVHEKPNGDYLVHTHKVILRGGFQELVSILYYLEKETFGMKVSSAEFTAKKNQRSRERELFLDIYIQSYEKFN